MSQQGTMKAADLLSVKSRVSWGAIAAGAMIALAVYFLLTLMGIAVGLEVAFRRTKIDLGVGAALWSIATLLFSMFIGGWSTSRLAVGESKTEAFLYGVILWGVLFVGLFWMNGQGIRVGFGAMMGMASGAVGVTADDSPEGEDAVPALVQRYNAMFGDQFFEDIAKLGLDRAQAEKVRDYAKKQIDTLRQSSDGGATTTSGGTGRVTSSELADRTREATWYTLAGVVISMLTVIIGSLSGSGELPIPVPLAGVRRPTAPPAPPRA